MIEILNIVLVHQANSKAPNNTNLATIYAYIAHIASLVVAGVTIKFINDKISYD